VVAVHVALPRAAGEAAAVVARLHGPADRRRNAARPAADAEGVAVFVFGDGHDARVAGEASGGIRGDPRAVAQLAATLTVALSQHPFIDVDRHQRALAASKRGRVSGEEALAHQQRIRRTKRIPQVR